MVKVVRQTESEASTEVDGLGLTGFGPDVMGIVLVTYATYQITTKPGGLKQIRSVFIICS